jgi:hypothetical protein
MSRAARATTVLTIRVPTALERRLASEARRRRRSRSALASQLLADALGGGEPDLATEARRQSLLVSRRSSEREALRFIRSAADTTGWK